MDAEAGDGVAKRKKFTRSTESSTEAAVRPADEKNSSTGSKKHIQKQKRAHVQKSEFRPPADLGVPSNRLFVSNIPFHTTEEQLSTIFQQCGPLKEAPTIARHADTGTSRGFGYVTFQDPAHATLAIEKMQGHCIKKRPISIVYARPVAGRFPASVSAQTDAEHKEKSKRKEHKRKVGDGEELKNVDAASHHLRGTVESLKFFASELGRTGLLRAKELRVACRDAVHTIDALPALMQTEQKISAELASGITGAIVEIASRCCTLLHTAFTTMDTDNLTSLQPSNVRAWKACIEHCVACASPSLSASLSPSLRPVCELFSDSQRQQLNADYAKFEYNMVWHFLKWERQHPSGMGSAAAFASANTSATGDMEDVVEEDDEKHTGSVLSPSAVHPPTADAEDPTIFGGDLTVAAQQWWKEQEAPLQQLRARQQAALQRLQTLVSGVVHWQGCGPMLQVYGSARSGLLIPGLSDLDVCIGFSIRQPESVAPPGADTSSKPTIHVPEEQDSETLARAARHRAMTALRFLAHALTALNETSPGSYRFVTSLRARVPVVRVTDLQVSLEMDVTLLDSTTLLKDDLLRQYASCDPRVPLLLRALKLWAYRRHLIGTAKNPALNSLGWYLMMIQFLQCGVKPAVLPVLPVPSQPSLAGTRATAASANTMSVGALFARFFQFYSEFKFEDAVISVRSGSPQSMTFSQRSQQFDCENVHVVVEDPACERENCARSVTQVSLRRMRRELMRGVVLTRVDKYHAVGVPAVAPLWTELVAEMHSDLSVASVLFQ